jgi:hypothetical protein
MPFTYCTDCGYKNVFTVKRANFCAGCGEPLLQSAQSSKTQEKTISSGAEELDDKALPQIGKLEYTIDVAKGSHTIGDLINSKKESTERVKRTPGREDGKNLTLKELEEESIRACSTSATPPTD